MLTIIVDIDQFKYPVTDVLHLGLGSGVIVLLQHVDNLQGHKESLHTHTDHVAFIANHVKYIGMAEDHEQIITQTYFTQHHRERIQHLFESFSLK